MYEYKCELDRVVDGDTVDVHIDLGFDVWLRSQRIRLYGIDTPESRTTDLVEKHYGLLAKDYVQDFLECKELTLVCEKYSSSGKYGRILGDIKVKGIEKTLCESLLGAHHAVLYDGQSKENIKEAHIANREYLQGV